jgi:hypothetical protein
MDDIPTKLDPIIIGWYNGYLYNIRLPTIVIIPEDNTLFT